LQVHRIEEETRIPTTSWTPGFSQRARKGRRDPRPQRSLSAGSGAPHPSRRKGEPQKDHRKKVSCSPNSLNACNRDYFAVCFSFSGTPKLQDSKTKTK